MNKHVLPVLCFFVLITAFSCTQMNLDDDSTLVDIDFETVMASVGTDRAAAAFAAYDLKYGTTLTTDFASELSEISYARSAGSSTWPVIPNMPFDTDGAVYLSGGGDDAVGTVVGWVAPKNLPGDYYHGAVFDLEKFDPNNLNSQCLQTAILKGAGYETAADWQTKVNVAILDPNFTIDKTKLDQAQTAVDYYCNLPTGQQQYGFFKSYVNIFNVVSKEDRYYWYCTKTVWEMYKDYGINIDSNDPRSDFTKSGLYSLGKAYFKARYFYSPSTAKNELNKYIVDSKEKIVFAEEILLSPYFTKAFEVIRK